MVELKTKERLKSGLKSLIQNTHKRHKDMPGRYRVNIVSTEALSDFSKEELEDMGFTVRPLPDIKDEDNG